MSPRTKKVLRWSRRVVLALFALVALAIAGALIFLHTDYGREVVRAQVQAKLNETFVGGAKIGQIDGTPFGELVLHDVVINDPTGQPAITVKRLGVELALLPLIRQEARLKGLTASDVDIALRRDEQGLLAGRMTRPGPKSGWSVELEHLAVHRAHLMIETPDGPINLDGIQILGSATLPAIGAIATQVGARAVWREKKAPILLDAIARVNEGVITVPTLSAMVGGVRATGSDVRIVPGEPGERPQLAGRITIDAPKREVAKLAPEVELPADVSATITARDRDPWTELVVIGRLGRTHAQVIASADLLAQRAVGIVASDAIDLPALSKGKVTGTGGVVVAFDAAYANAQPVAHGVVSAWGQVADLPGLQSAIAFSAVGQRISTTAGVAGPALQASLGADMVVRDETLVLERSTILASTTNPRAASGGAAPIRGALDVRLSANGQLAPAPNLAVEGRVIGKRVRMQDLSVGTLDVAIAASGLPDAPRGKAEVVLDDLIRGDMMLGYLKVTAGSQNDGRLAVAVRSRPKFAPWLVDVDAWVTPPRRADTWLVDIVRHHVRVGEDGEWRGTTGRIAIAPNSYSVENLTSSSTRGSFALSASLRPHHLDVSLKASRTKLGAASIELDVDAPVAFTNPEAWKRLERADIRKAALALNALNLAELAELLGRPGEAVGRIDGELALSPTAASGSVKLTGVKTKATERLGALDAGLTIAANKNEIVPTLIGHMVGIGRFQATARVDLPARPLDPQSWETRSMRGAQVAIDDITLEPGLLDRFGMTTELRGRVKIVAEIGEALRSANVQLDVTRLRGDPIVQPVDTRLVAALDQTKGTATLRVTSGRAMLLDGRVDLPMTIDEVLADPARIMTVPIKGLVTIPSAPAPTLMNVFGRAEVVGGTLRGTITVGGTLGKPRIVASVVGDKLEVPPGPRNRPVKVLDKVTIDGSFIDGVVKGRIQGTQRGGYLDVFAIADPRNLKAGRVTLKAKEFDLQPLLVMAPGPAGATRGMLDADLTVESLDPVSARARGTLRITRGRIPIAPQVGTLRRANIDVRIGPNTMSINGEGRLGQGTVKVASTIQIDGAQPSSGEATLTLREVSPIGTVEPVIDADVKLRMRREPDRYVVDAQVSNASVKVPEGRGEALKPVGAPSDMVYATGEKVTRRPMQKEPPKRPGLVVNVTLGATHVESAEIRGLIRGKVTLTADADAVGILGSIEAYRGDLDLFGRRYQVERAAVRFDGTTDPLLDLRIVHDFPDVTTRTTVRGRLSKPELVMSSDPPIYSQSQLLGFLLGGEPNGDPQQGSAREVATNAGASFIANRLGGYVKKALPVDIDVIRYESATASESAAVTVGTWLTRNWFLAYRRRIEAMPDENANEVEAEYWISRRVLIEGSTGDRAVSGIDLLWRRRY